MTIHVTRGEPVSFPGAVRKGFNWPYIFGWCWCKLCTLTMKFLLFVVYTSIIREGFTMFMPPTAQKLSRFPGASFLADYEATHKLDVAFVLSVVMLVAVFYFTQRALRFWLYGSGESPAKAYQLRQEYFIATGAIALLTIDAVLFYTAVTTGSWGGGSFSLSAVLATAAYVLVLLFAAKSTVTMNHELNQKYKGN